MEKIDSLTGFRNALILTNTFGIIFAFAALIVCFDGTSLILILLLALSSSISLWVQGKAAKTQRIRLPILPHDIGESGSTSPFRHSLVACADLVSGTLLLTLHVISMIVTNHNGLGVISLYAVFAALLASLLHYALFILHLVAWRREVNRNQPRCQFCQQRVDHSVEAGQARSSDDGAGSPKIVMEESAPLQI